MRDHLEDWECKLLEATPPVIDVGSLPQVERLHANSITILLSILDSFILDFHGALTLFDHLESDKYPLVLQGSRRWSILAAREAVMAVWKFDEALEHINVAFKNCPTIRDKLGKNALKPTIGLLRASFPNIKDMRNSMVHPAQRLGKPEDRNADKLISSNGCLVIHSVLQGRDMIISRHGRHHSLEISENSLDRLRTIKKMAFQVFRNIG